MHSHVPLPVIISCLSLRCGEGQEHHLEIAESILDFQKATTVKFPLSSLSGIPYHLNFGGQKLGWASIAGSAEKEMAKWIILFAA